MEHEKHHQVRQQSGTPYSFRLDYNTLQSLAALQEAYQKMGLKFSQGVIVRRALRKHSEYIVSLTDYQTELIETLRASKGIL